MGVKKKGGVGTAGRFGARYGLKIRRSIKEIEALQKRKHECPYCHKKGVKRLSKGVWECKKCKTKFTGEAYTPVKMKGGE